jgi:predicted O-methyltransferase YrrM
MIVRLRDRIGGGIGVRTAIRLAVTSPSEFVRVVRHRNGPPRLRTLERLIRDRKPQVIVEIGVWRGDTAIRMIQAADQGVRYWGFDLFSQEMTDEIMSREVSLRPLSLEEVRARLQGLGAEVNLVAGDSTLTLPSTELPPVDFAFIDGGHSYETVSADWQNIRPRLAPGAVVVFDDYTNLLAVEREGYGVRRLVDELRGDFRIELLKPVDVFPREYGRLETRLALLWTY